jgi:hypothetical protein
MDACPKCGYQRQAKDADPYLECPRCGIVFTKFVKHHPAPVAEEVVPVQDITGYTDAELPPLPWYQRLWNRLMELPDQPEPVSLGAQALVLVVMIAWGVPLIRDRLITADIMGSFWHEVDLPIHEFGHMLFRPFGQWMMYLGGSLFQCLLPALIGVAFIWKMRNPFGAAFCLWWTAENVLDVAPYIYDARMMAMPLVGEWNDEVAQMHALRHDWHNILLRFDAVDSGWALGNAAHVVGAALMILSWVWAGTWLWQAWQASRDTPA